MEKELDIKEVAKLMEENEIGDLGELRKLLGDYKKLCNDVVQLTLVITFLNSFLDGNEMGEEARRFVKKCMEERLGTNSRGKA